jgi:hypothetical protein
LFGFVLSSLIVSVVLAQKRPDFSGTWTFSRVKSLQPGPNGQVVLAALLGDEFTVKQDATSLSLSIKAGTVQASAVYKLDGSESRNLSPAGPGQPDIEVISKATWEGDKLVVNSTSTSPVDGRPTQIVTKRVMWIEKDGSLILERTGTPADQIPQTRSVYVRAAK